MLYESLGDDPMEFEYQHPRHFDIGKPHSSPATPTPLSSLPKAPLATPPSPSPRSTSLFSTLFRRRSKKKSKETNDDTIHAELRQMGLSDHDEQSSSSSDQNLALVPYKPADEPPASAPAAPAMSFSPTPLHTRHNDAPGSSGKSTGIGIDLDDAPFHHRRHASPRASEPLRHQSAPATAPSYTSNPYVHQPMHRPFDAYHAHDEDPTLLHHMSQSSSRNMASQPYPYPMEASFYQHDPVADRRSILIYYSGLIRIGCEIAFYCMLFYLVVQFMIVLKQDMVTKMALYESNHLDKQLQCSRDYHHSECATRMRPAMKEICDQWQKCIFEPAWMGKTKVIAETFADIVNGFVDTISYKSMTLINVPGFLF
ncbi:Di-sulfide bridge nucleocytoplasmic transport domain-containing protein [Gongronella butleri]|nr:Di-sulfide bridge nucleocytoplasmic transport domain-containing protein [Gongronella butleri]